MAPDNEHRAAWSAVALAVMTVFVGLSVLAWQAGNGSSNDVAQPAFAFFALGAVIAFYMSLAPLLHWPPYRRKPEPEPEVLAKPEPEPRQRRPRPEPRPGQAPGMRAFEELRGPRPPDDEVRP